MQAYIDKLHRQHKRKERKSNSSPSSFSNFDPDDQLITISEYLLNVSHKKPAGLDAQDVIIASSMQKLRLFLSFQPSSFLLKFLFHIMFP